MKEWLRVRKADGAIVGWQRAGKATSVPAGDAEIDNIEADLQGYFAASAALRADGREESEAKWDGAKVVTSADTRPTVRVAFSKPEVQADGADSVTLTITALNAQGQPATNFNATRRITLLGRLLKLQFTSGICTKNLTFRESGSYTIASTPQVKIETPVSLDVVE